jgi:hypothetical protein
VFYKSGNRIDLLPGFEARYGNTFFKAYIGPCGNGLPTIDSENGDANETSLPVLTSNFPNGALIKTPGEGTGSIRFKVPVAGTYSIVAVDENGKLLETLIQPASFQAGIHNTLSVSKPSGTFYIQLWRDQTLCDSKEW